jgi:DNA-binding Xre family transcriptional regulator
MKKKEIPEINDLINIAPVRKMIARKFITTYRYCKQNKISESEMSIFLNKKRPITLQLLQKHCYNLDLGIKILICKK